MPETPLKQGDRVRPKKRNPWAECRITDTAIIGGFVPDVAGEVWVIPHIKGMRYWRLSDLERVPTKKGSSK